MATKCQQERSCSSCHVSPSSTCLALATPESQHHKNTTKWNTTEKLRCKLCGQVYNISHSQKSLEIFLGTLTLHARHTCPSLRIHDATSHALLIKTTFTQNVTLQIALEVCSKWALSPSFTQVNNHMREMPWDSASSSSTRGYTPTAQLLPFITALLRANKQRDIQKQPSTSSFTQAVSLLVLMETINKQSFKYKDNKNNIPFPLRPPQKISQFARSVAETHVKSMWESQTPD